MQYTQNIFTLDGFFQMALAGLFIGAIALVVFSLGVVIKHWRDRRKQFKEFFNNQRFISQNTFQNLNNYTNTKNFPKQNTNNFRNSNQRPINNINNKNGNN